jgi:ppGpp synthetase/RelA/SpoT-type nucleotidyltranferase
MANQAKRISRGALKTSYDHTLPVAVRFKEKLMEEIGELLKQADVSLATPLEGRIKDWKSIVQKINNSNLHFDSAIDIKDLIGIRLILVFKRDIDRVCETLSRIFEVLDSEDTEIRLGQNEFGYQSIHLQIQAPKDWLNLPSFSGFRELTAEIQVRTLSQHLWAAASHILQYKVEKGVPPPVRRSINRVSALLETVDLEFERVLHDREEYISQIENLQPKTPLDVDLLRHFLDVRLPRLAPPGGEEYVNLIKAFHDSGISPGEDYVNLIEDLYEAGISTVEGLIDLFDNAHASVIEEESKIVEAFGNPWEIVDYAEEAEDWSFGDIDFDKIKWIAIDGRQYMADRSMLEQKEYFTRTALVRMMLLVP